MSVLTSQQVEQFLDHCRPFLTYLKEMEASWPTLAFSDLVEQAGGPDKVAVVAVDLLKGFCDQGPLASPRVRAIVEPAVRILSRAHELGVRHFAFTCDAHTPESVEFRQWPPHCLQGTPEAELVDEIARLPFASEFHVLPKDSINSMHGTQLPHWLDGRWHLTRVVALGDCTDLCLHELAMDLRVRANALKKPYEVVVPASAAATYDLPVETARKLGVMPHDGDLLHLVFLYHMQLNGIQVVRDLV